MLIFVLIAVIVYTYILKKKFLKDQKEYMYYRDIPSKDSPAFVGKIVKGHTDGNDIIATIKVTARCSGSPIVPIKIAII